MICKIIWLNMKIKVVTALYSIWPHCFAVWYNLSERNVASSGCGTNKMHNSGLGLNVNMFRECCTDYTKNTTVPNNKPFIRSGRWWLLTRLLSRTLSNQSIRRINQAWRHLPPIWFLSKLRTYICDIGILTLYKN